MDSLAAIQGMKLRLKQEKCPYLKVAWSCPALPYKWGCCWLHGDGIPILADLSDNILASAKPHTYAFCPALNSGAIKSYFSLQQKLITQNSSLLILRIPQLLTLLILHLVSDAGATTTHDQHLRRVLISKYRDLQPRFKINISFVIIKNH